MEDTEQSRTIQDAQEEEIEEDKSPSRGTVLILLVCALLIIVGVFAKYILNLNIDHEKECSYRGGVWDSSIEECVYENGVGGIEQVGMTIPTVSLRIPGTEEDALFKSVGVGFTQIQEEMFASGTMQGSVVLNTALGKVQKSTQDLLMPFSVRVDKSPEEMYLGVFAKTPNEGYVLSKAEYVGRAIGQENLTVTPGDNASEYRTRFSFRERNEGEPLSAVPTEPRAFDVVVRNHTFVEVQVTGRAGILYSKVVE